MFMECFPPATTTTTTKSTTIRRAATSLSVSLWMSMDCVDLALVPSPLNPQHCPYQCPLSTLLVLKTMMMMMMFMVIVITCRWWRWWWWCVSLYWPPSWQIPNRAQRSEPGETFLIGLHENEVSQRCMSGFTIEQMFLFSCLNMMSCAFRIIFHQTEVFSSLASDNLTCRVTFNHVSKKYSLGEFNMWCELPLLLAIRSGIEDKIRESRKSWLEQQLEK